MTTPEFKAEVLRLVRELSILLAEHPFQAGVVTALGEAVDTDTSNIATLYGGGELWGGSGSVCDVELRDAEARRRKWQLIIELVDCFERYGHTNPGASFSRRLYKDWLARGL